MRGKTFGIPSWRPKGENEPPTGIQTRSGNMKPASFLPRSCDQLKLQRQKPVDKEKIKDFENIVKILDKLDGLENESTKVRLRERINKAKTNQIHEDGTKVWLEPSIQGQARDGRVEEANNRPWAEAF